MAANHLLLLGIATSAIGLVLKVVAVATTHWATVTGLIGAGDVYLGLFKICSDKCISYEKVPGSAHNPKGVSFGKTLNAEFSTPHPDANWIQASKVFGEDSLYAVRALVIIGVLGSFVGIVLGGSCYYFQFLNKNSNIKFHAYSLMAHVISDVLPVAGAIVFRATTYDDLTGGLLGVLDYSYFICIIGGILAWLSGWLIFRAGCRI